MWNNCHEIAQIAQERHTQMIADAERNRMIRQAQAHRPQLTIRQIGRQVWLKRWRVLPVMMNVSRPPSTETEELPQVSLRIEY